MTTELIDGLFKQLGVPTVVSKPANTSRGDTAVRALDPDLQLSVLQNTIYIVETWLGYEATTAADISQGWSGPAGASMQWGANSLASTATSNLSPTSRQLLTTINSTNTLGGVGSGSGVEARPGGLLTVGATPGTFGLMWAAAVAGAVGDAILYANSWLRLTPIA